MREDVAYESPTQKVLAESARPGNQLLLARVADGALDESGDPIMNQLSRDPVRVGPIPETPRKVLASTSGAMCISSRRTLLAARL